MESLVGYLGCGNYYSPSAYNHVVFEGTKFSYIIPFFDKYPLVGAKTQDYLDLKRVANFFS